MDINGGTKMFSSNSSLIPILAVVLSLSVILAMIYWVNRMFANDTQEILVKFILMVFTALVGVYIVDKVIAFKISLLSEDEDRELFELIKTLVLMIFSYYFGTKNNTTQNEN